MKNITNRQFEIIEAAGKILTESGISGLTIKNLAKQMQFSESALYRHFQSKEEVIITMLDYLQQQVSELATLTSPSHSAWENIETIFMAQFQFFAKNPHFVVAVFSDGLMEENQKINACILNIMQTRMKVLLPLITKGQEDGSLKDTLPAEQVILVIMGAVRLQMFRWQMANFQFDIIEEGKKLLHSLYLLVKNE